MDGTAAGLERDPRAAVHLFCRTHARITPPEPDVKGLRAAVRGAPMNGGLAAALDIHPRRRYTAHKAASRINPLPRTMDDPALFMPHLEFTQNLGLTQAGPVEGALFRQVHS